MELQNVQKKYLATFHLQRDVHSLPCTVMVILLSSVPYAVTALQVYSLL